MRIWFLGKRAEQLGLLSAAFAALTMASAPADEAKPFLHPLFTDNMVLQRGVADSVWGWTTPGQTVTVSLDGKTAQGVAGTDGKWTAKIGPFKEGGPYTLTVKGTQTVTRQNVLIGDVWLCSGQSNMQFGIGNTLHAEDEIAAANYPNIRLFMVGNQIATVPNPTPSSGTWDVCTPQTVKQGGWNGFSAVGYFFGRGLSQDLHVPIGLIESNWGGTPAEAWTSTEALSTMADFRPTLAAMKQIQANGGDIDALMAPWYARHDPGSAGKTWANTDLNTADWKPIALPVLFQEAGIPELSSTNGVVWFRREFDLPAAWAGKDLTLHLGPIDDRDTTYVNSVKVGGLNAYDAPRDYTVPATVLKPGRNVIAVRVLDTGGKGGIYGKPEQMKLEAAGAPAPPVSLAGLWLCRLGTPLITDDPVPQLPGNGPNEPTVLYNGMIAPLVPFGLKGAIWYQGEANAGNGKQYQTLLPTMIGDWRSRFGTELPFYIVQLANFDPSYKPGALAPPAKSSWAELREAQLLTSQHLPKTGLAVTVDVGDAGDIHPKDKQDVGHRLVLAAEALTYGKKLEYSGPQYQSMTVEGNMVRLKFTHLGGGLVAKGGDKLLGFEVAGSDGQFVWADAKIDGDTVVVSAASVPNPTDVRYAWADNPICNLTNKADLPASPFRTGK
jgi:sialate O-acetylesterase